MKRTVSLLLILALLAALLSGCLVKLPERRPTDIPAPTESSADPSTEPSEPTQVEAPLPDAQIITELYAVDEEYVSYHLPQFISSDTDFAQVNEELRAEYEDLILSCMEYVQQGIAPGCYNIGWKTIWYETYLTLFTYCTYEGDYTVHRVYCFDYPAGRRLSNEEILQVTGVDADAFLPLAKAAAQVQFKANFPEDLVSEYIDEAEYERLLQESVSDEYINLDMRMYPGRTGTLMLISPIASMAGAGAYERIYPLEAVITSGSFADQTVLEGESFSYRVPRIQIDGFDDLNREIEDTYQDIIAEATQSGADPYCERIIWWVCWSGETCALIIVSSYPSDCRYYQVYNFNVITGERIDNETLMEFAGIDPEEFTEQAKAAAEQCYTQKYSYAEKDEFYEAQLNATVSDERINPDMRMYLEADGTLMLISPIGSLAGADSYEEFYPLR